MTTPNVCQFPTSSPTPVSYVTHTPSSRRPRSRALSLLSVKSGDSVKLCPESPKAQPTILTSNSFKKHLACGSFVPNPPATAVLRTFLPTMVSHTRGRSRYIYTHYEKEDVQSPASPVPLITRTLPLSSNSRSPSPVRIYPAYPKVRRPSHNRARSEVLSSDLHPILASLEQRSKFCVKKGTCSTCRRSGSGFPQCPKCGDNWCSRECRLKGGKKHVCRTAPT